ncbi:MAG: 4Fe-4S dicluster domain-containing protein [Candidatus Aenigmarchaeota archaeon]|nr:4Fe-4S dicluster domain-containing protein [Candidatus Aenigmarchaeota archaeon]
MSGSKFYVIKKSDFPKFIGSLSKNFKVFAPVRGEKDFNFKEIKPSKEIDLEGYINTEFPPKKFFIPDGEVLMEYEKGGKVKRKPAKGRKILFGVRPCDVHGLIVLDKVMMSEPVDVFYKNKRDSILVFALNCREAGENCFCESMGAKEAKEGFDLLFTDHGDEYHVEVGSEKGKEVIGKSRLFKETDKEAEKAKLVFKKKINTENLPEIMKDRFESKIWEETANKKCLSCASCTSVCPTCYCFDVFHLNSIEKPGSGKIIREWSYCMLKPFTKVAGEMIFREPRVERVKQFFYHKLVYGKENQGKYHCVGCGRCITECMTKIDITEEVRKIRDEYEKRKLRA